jgi:hypothetical protein
MQAQDGVRPSPTRATGLLPRPPRQDEAWTPPESGIPGAFVDAARALFEQGLADPRGCAYRDVELAGQAEAYRGLVKRPPATHAWVLPFDVTGGPRSAVAWNGLVYPVTRLGPAADLEADIQALVKPFEAPARGGERQVRRYQFSRDPMGGPSSGDLVTAWQDEFTPIKAILLLRLGRGDLAKLVWKAGLGWPPTANEGVPAEDRALYANLAADWEWALLDRAASAHSRGDDPLALASLRELARIRPLIQARSVLAEPPPGAGPRNRPGVLPVPVAVDFLVQLPQFLADQERRAREPKRVPAIEATFRDRAARIAALIRDFDQVSQRPFFLPGRANPAGDASVQSVIKEGDAAVEPLLDCLERDDRLTRTVDRDDRHRSRYIHVQGVDEAAYAALVSILGTRELGPQARFYGGRSDRLRRKAVAAEIHDYWQKNRGLGPVERLFRTLADDAATPEQWLDTAEALAQPNDVRGRGGSYVTPYRFGGGVPPPRGEPLRGRANPSITELMARRTREIDPPDGPPASSFDVPKANRMASFLAAWDLKGSLPTLKARVARCAAILGGKEAKSNGYEGLAAEIARFTTLRVKGGDAAALDDYAAWARTTRPPVYGFFAPEMFEPLWKYPDHPAIAAASIALFDDPASPWVPLFRPGDSGWGELGSRSDIITSPMLGAAPFRKQVLAGLADDRPAGSVQCDAAGKVTIVLDKSLSMLPTFHAADPHRPRPGLSMPLRMRDNYAWKLKEVGGFPRFELYWPPELRDRTIAEVVALLSRYGERFRTTEVGQALYEKASFYPRHVRAVLVFPTLDRPATAADVAAGRAIFAVGPGAEARRWPMPSFPMAGRWMELEVPPDDPFLRQFDRVPEKHSPQLEYAQRGLVWQVEEIREGDRWRRYYGFVGRHVMARVPATELDFPAPWNTGWFAISHDLDGRLVPPGGRDDGRLILTAPGPVGGPLPIVATLRNHRGIAATIPTDLARTGGRLALRAGVSIRVFREPEPVRKNPVAGFSRAVQEPAPWPEIAPRGEPARYRSDAARALEPTGTAEVLRLDLRDLFELDRPGRYRVDVAFDDVRTEDGKPGMMSGHFTLEPAAGADGR